MSTYPEGQTVRIGPGPDNAAGLELRDATGVLVNASASTLKVLLPDGTQQTVTPVVNPSTGIYYADYLPAGEGVHTWEWVFTVGTAQAVKVGEFTVAASPMEAPASATTAYATPTELRAALDVDQNVLDDAAATALILDAEDLIDRVLGGWPPDETTGRKIVQGDVEAWQWAKLGRATAKLAARLHRDPGLLSSPVYRSVSGPDFSFVGPQGGGAGQVFGVQVLALLDDSGLRRVAGRAVTGSPRRKPEYDRFLSATRHDGT